MEGQSKSAPRKTSELFLLQNHFIAFQPLLLFCLCLDNAVCGQQPNVACA